MRFKPGISNLMALLSYILLALSLCSPASATSFTWRDDPFSGVNTSAISVSHSGNTVTFSNFQAGSAEASPDLAVIVPWIFPRLAGIIYSMEWSNANDGWVNNDVAGTSLLITLDNVSNRLLFGNVADVTGTAPLDPTRIVNDLGQTVSQTRSPGDLVPFLDLGAFAANQVKTFDLTFTYHFGDQRALTDDFIYGFLNTISQVPEPPILALLGIAFLGFCLSRLSGKSPKQIG